MRSAGRGLAQSRLVFEGDVGTMPRQRVWIFTPQEIDDLLANLTAQIPGGRSRIGAEQNAQLQRRLLGVGYLHAEHLPVPQRRLLGEFLRLLPDTIDRR